MPDCAIRAPQPVHAWVPQNTHKRNSRPTRRPPHLLAIAIGTVGGGIVLLLLCLLRLGLGHLLPVRRLRLLAIGSLRLLAVRGLRLLTIRGLGLLAVGSIASILRSSGRLGSRVGRGGGSGGLGGGGRRGGLRGRGGGRLLGLREGRVGDGGGRGGGGSRGILLGRRGRGGGLSWLGGRLQRKQQARAAGWLKEGRAQLLAAELWACPSPAEHLAILPA